MGRIILVCLLLLAQTGCVVVSAVGGGMVDGAMYLFKTEKESLPISMRETLVATQQSLEKLSLQANLVEPVDHGYILEFSNNKLEGTITLIQETEHLTTIAARVHKGMSREKSVEKAIFEKIRKESKHVKHSDHFNFTKYNNIRHKPLRRAQKVGWYIPGTKLDVSPMKVKGWLRVKMPSGARGFLKGEIVK